MSAVAHWRYPAGSLDVLSISSDATLVAFGNHVGGIQIVDIASGHTKKAFPPTGGVSLSCAFLPHRRIAIAEGTRIRLYAYDTGGLLLDKSFNAQECTLLQYSTPLNSVLLAIDRNVVKWDLGSPDQVKSLGELTRPCKASALFPHGTFLVTSVSSRLTGSNPHYPAEIQLWDLHRHERRCQISTSIGRVLALAVDPTEKLLAAGTDTNCIALWHLDDPKNGEKMIPVKTGARFVAFLGHPDYLITAGSNTLSFVCVPTQTVVHQVPMDSAITHLESTPTGDRIIIGHEDGGVSIFHLDVSSLPR